MHMKKLHWLCIFAFVLCISIKIFYNVPNICCFVMNAKKKKNENCLFLISFALSPYKKHMITLISQHTFVCVCFIASIYSFHSWHFLFALSISVSFRLKQCQFIITINVQSTVLHAIRQYCIKRNVGDFTSISGFKVALAVVLNQY